MKALNLNCFFFVIPFLFSNKLAARHTKLNIAFYYSSGIVAESKGNVFVTGKINKVIKFSAKEK